MLRNNLFVMQEDHQGDQEAHRANMILLIPLILLIASECHLWLELLIQAQVSRIFSMT